MKRIVISAVCIILVIACTERQDTYYTTIIKTDVIGTELCSDIVSPDSTVTLFNWCLVDDNLAINSSQTEGIIQLWSWPGLHYKNKVLKIGRGPGEFISANWAECALNNKIALYDIPSRRIRSYVIQRDSLFLCLDYDLIGTNAEEKSLLKPYVNILQINDSIYVMRASDRSRDELSVVDLSNKNILSFYRDILKRDRTKDQYLGYDYLLKTNGKYIIKAYESFNRIEILELSDDKDLVPRYVITDSLESQNSTLIYYNDIICTDNWFACLFAGNSSGNAVVLELYNYKGEQLDRIKLNHSLTHILYDKERHVFCGYDANSEENYFYLFSYVMP